MTTAVEQITKILDQTLPDGLGLKHLHPHLAARIVRAINQPDPFPEKEAPGVLLTARWDCPCNKGDVLLASVMLPFDIPETVFQATMRQWWTELKHEARAHLNKPAEAKAS